ncbi:ADP-ribosylation factor GTPase-activating protein 2 isoform X2 [Drosophila tropicalis]|uniref:ADP-ribosylation factor GTPase-activating protein 2 isoform X2 n=1 Tax=Drosophila tropicalis TaxID=46794 RepID=UPI0035ABFAC4
MAAGPTKQEIESVFSRLRAQPANKSCFDCAAKAPTWSSVTYGIFICIDCSAVHRNLGVHLTFVRSTNLDTNWTWLQLRQMQLGGNANAAQFFRAHNCTSTDAQVKYNSRAAQLYKDKLTAQAQQVMKIHGTKLDTKPIVTPAPAVPVAATAAANDTARLGGGAPSVILLNSVVQPNATVPSSIGVRKIQPKKGGLGARKVGGLGATKVKTNFADIEARANAANELRSADAAALSAASSTTNNTGDKSNPEEELEQVASMRLAYQELSLQKTREEAKLKTMDPAKAKQMERLGMGFQLRGSDVAHSALSDMETIQQAAAPKAKLSQLDNENFFQDYSLNLYNSSSNHSSEKKDSNATSTSSSSKLDKFELDALGYETIEPIGGTHSNITSMFAAEQQPASSSISSSTNRSKNSNKINIKPANDPVMAQQKFGNSKGFGSDQYFASEQSSADISANLNRFQGSRAISSSDYFNDGSAGGSQRGGGGGAGGGGYSSSVNFNAPRFGCGER